MQIPSEEVDLEPLSPASWASTLTTNREKWSVLYNYTANIIRASVVLHGFFLSEESGTDADARWKWITTKVRWG